MQEHARFRVDHDLHHAQRRCELFRQAGLHAGAHPEELLPQESQEELRQLCATQQEFALEAQFVRGK